MGKTTGSSAAIAFLAAASIATEPIDWAGAKVDASTNAGGTPLMAAVQTQRGQIVEVLIDAGADVNARDIHGTAPLQAARSKRDDLIIRLLKEAGAQQ